MNQFGTDSDSNLKNDPLFNPKYEEQFILRMPERIADKLRDPAVLATVEFHWKGSSSEHLGKSVRLTFLGNSNRSKTWNNDC